MSNVLNIVSTSLWLLREHSLTHINLAQRIHTNAGVYIGWFKDQLLRFSSLGTGTMHYPPVFWSLV